MTHSLYPGVADKRLCLLHDIYDPNTQDETKFLKRIQVLFLALPMAPECCVARTQCVQQET